MIICVLVAYNPVLELLERAVGGLLGQVDYIVIVDNSACSILNFESENIFVEALGENIGIAAAQNIGISKAIDMGAEYVLLSDQDTLYPPDYLNNMLPVFKEFPEACVVVPKFSDSNKKGSDGFISVTPVCFRRIFPESGKHKISQAICSGKLIRSSTFRTIGLMDERLFIDWVDLEWCWRARARGFEIIANADVVIQHQLGDLSKNMGFREVNLRSPVRHYYITRNAFYLALYSRDLDLGHRMNLFIRSFRYIFGFPLLARPFPANLKAVMIGFWHGVTARLGKY
ncbi:glycosyltransferase family 2 protein [Stutzerimonas stutzeri]|uniref:glycosyltransferase family 2 protein n=1 Tax=Stutzerimonas stutzeri TaxID=316 RepID=UPI003B786EFC